VIVAAYSSLPHNYHRLPLTGSNIDGSKEEKDVADCLGDLGTLGGRHTVVVTWHLLDGGRCGMGNATKDQDFRPRSQPRYFLPSLNMAILHLSIHKHHHRVGICGGAVCASTIS
jgi:hypothetical protein